MANPPFIGPTGPTPTPNPLNTGPNPQPGTSISGADKQAAEDYLDTINDINSKSKEIHNILLEQVKALKEARKESKNFYDLQDQIKKIKAERIELLKEEKSLGKELTGISQKAKDIIDEGFKARRKADEAQRLLNSLTEQYNTSLNAGTLTYEEQAKLAAKIATQEQNLLNTLDKEKELSKLLVGNYDILNKNLSDKEKQLIRNYLEVKKENEEIKLQKDNGTDILKLLKAEANVLEVQLTSWQKINQRVDYLNDKLKSIKVISETIDWGKKQLDTIGISFTAILKSVLDYNKTITDAAKALGISVDGVRQLAEGYEETALHSESYNKAANAAFLSIKNQLVAQQELNKSLGTSGLVTAQARVDQVVLTKQMGLQAEEAANLYKLGRLSEKSANDVAKTTAQQVINLRQQKGINLDLKQVLIDVGKVSGQLSAQYKNNPELLAKAVVQAKELGLTLEQTARMGDKLLDFPGSIESELKAELLTGKALNLEQARYLTLMGDSAGAAKELMNNVGGLAEFQNLNVLQQRALAEAVGMTADELSNSLQQQKLLEGSAWATQAAFDEAIKNADTQEEKAQILAQIKQSDNADQLLKQYEQISAQEKFNQSIEKLKEMLANLIDGPFGKFLDGLADAVSNAAVLKGIMFAIGGIIAGNMLKGIASFGIQMAAAIAPSSAVAAANIASASALTLGIGAIAIIAGIVAGIAALNSATGENINVSQASGGASSGINPSGGAINVPPSEKERPIVVEAKIQNQIAYNNRTIQEQNTVATMGTNNKVT
jgi:hypothetical protein